LKRAREKEKSFCGFFFFLFEIGSGAYRIPPAAGGAVGRVVAFSPLQVGAGFQNGTHNGAVVQKMKVVVQKMKVVVQRMQVDQITNAEIV
jgi:hypothetical protein